MPKSSRETIDLHEKAVIKELQKNCKESIDFIAKKSKFSRQKVWRIIKRLEKNKTILGYHAIVDDEKLHQKKYLIMIKRTTKPFDKETLDKILKQDIYENGVMIENHYFTHGSFDIFITIIAHNTLEMKRFCEKIIGSMQGYIKDIQVLEVLIPLKDGMIDNPNKDKVKEIFL